MADPYKPSAVQLSGTTTRTFSRARWITSCVLITAVILYVVAWPIANTMSPGPTSRTPSFKDRQWWMFARWTQQIAFTLGLPTLAILVFLLIKDSLATKRLNARVHGTVEPTAEKTSGQSDAP